MTVEDIDHAAERGENEIYNKLTGISELKSDSQQTQLPEVKEERKEGDAPDSQGESDSEEDEEGEGSGSESEGKKKKVSVSLKGMTKE